MLFFFLRWFFQLVIGGQVIAKQTFVVHRSAMDLRSHLFHFSSVKHISFAVPVSLASPVSLQDWRFLKEIYFTTLFSKCWKFSKHSVFKLLLLMGRVEIVPKRPWHSIWDVGSSEHSISLAAARFLTLRTVLAFSAAG